MADEYRAILFGDTQFHPWQEAERPDRWKEMVGVIDKVYAYAKKVKADEVIFMGDLFESKRAPRVDVTMEVLRSFYRGDTSTVFLMGNHDIFRGHTLIELMEVLTIRNAYTTVRDIANLTFKELTPQTYAVFAPYGFCQWASWNRDDLISGAAMKLLFCHGVTPMRKMGGGTSPGDIDLETLSNFDYVFNGHYHEPEDYDHHIGCPAQQATTHYHHVGSPYHIDWSDVDMPHRGFTDLHVVGAKVTAKRVILNEYPRFLSSSAQHHRDIDFVRPDLSVATDSSEREKVEEIGGAHALKDSIEPYLKEAGIVKAQRPHLARVGCSMLKKGA